MTSEQCKGCEHLIKKYVSGVTLRYCGAFTFKDAKGNPYNMPIFDISYCDIKDIWDESERSKGWTNHARL